MEEDRIIDYLYKRLKNRHLWFVTKKDTKNNSWIAKPKKYYDLDEYGELKNKSKVAKEITDYIGDGANTLFEAVSLFIEDGISDGSILTNDYLDTEFKDKPVEYTDTAVEVNNIEPKYIKPEITGSNKQVESKQLKKENYDKENICPICGAEMKIDVDSLNCGAHFTNSVGYFYYPWICPICNTLGDAEYIVNEDGIESFNKYLNIKRGIDFEDNLNENISTKQEDIFNDVSNGIAEYGVYDDTDIRNIKDRYKEPINAKRNKIRNFQDKRFTNTPVRDIINKGVTHVSYEKMPNERVQAYKNSKKEENVQRRLEEENNKSANIISDMFQSKDFDSESKMGKIVMRTSNLFNALSDKGYDVQVSFDNGESTNTILLGQQGGQIKITINDINIPLKAFTDGSFEITEDNIKTLENIKKEIETI